MKYNGNLKFTELEGEVSRTYTFDSGRTLTIKNVTHLSVSKNGHRLLDAESVSHYVPMGWVHLKWKVIDGSPNFTL